MSPSILSDLLGWASIGCWLGAQFPQVLENIRRQSCDGLAMPFLLNWLLGDITNLIGCLLTHQLPFQTILASYFVSVDFMLFSQYFYYRSASTSLLSASPTQRYSSSAGGGAGGGLVRAFSSEHEHHHYRELSTAAASVAVAAALAASDEELHARAASPADARQATHRRTSTSITRSEAEEAEDEVDADALAALADSFHSEGGRRRVSWSRERHAGGGGSTSRTRARGGLSPLTTMHSSLLLSPDAERAEGGALPDWEPGGVRGRPRQRQVVESPLGEEDLESQLGALERSASMSTAKERRSSRASHRSAGLVFLGVWALFGIGTLSGTRNTISTTVWTSPTSSQGAVLSGENHELELHSVSISDSPGLEDPLNLLHFPSAVESLHQEDADFEPPPEEPSSERVLGRISAWMCTTLYLTSRLPQIWKNYVRKSVEGLSMYLFIFAFLGNTFYVLSILASPQMSQPRPASTAFILESMPYLLGSGGTLLFDVTIVTQSVLYRPKPGREHRPRPSHSRSHTGSGAPAYHTKQGNAAGGGGHASSIHTQSPYARVPSVRGRSASALGRRSSVSAVPEEETALLGSVDVSSLRDVEPGTGSEAEWAAAAARQSASGGGYARRRKDEGPGLEAHGISS